jgi:hypothetical protein
MFRGPLLHLGAGLFAGQLALEHLGANRLALGTELLDEGLLFRRRVGAESCAVAGGESGARTGAEPSTSAGAETLTRTGKGAPLPDEAPALMDALPHPHTASTLAGEAAHLLLVLDALRLTTGEFVDSRKCPGRQATLRESRYGGCGQSYGKTKELDGAHLRLPMSVGDWTAPFAEWTLGDRRC